MNRCALTTALLGLSLCLPASLQAQPVPDTYPYASATAQEPAVVGRQGRRFSDSRLERGTVEVRGPRDVVLNGQPLRVSVAARLRNERNRLVSLNDYVGQKLVVNYRLDNRGNMGDMWILTEAERAKVLPSEGRRMRAANEGLPKYNGPVFQPGKPFNEQPSYPGQF